MRKSPWKSVVKIINKRSWCWMTCKPRLKKKNISSFVFFRWEAAQMSGVRESVQPELQPHHAQQETHRIQTVRLRPLRQRLPEESGPEEAQRDAARTEVKPEWSRHHRTKCVFRVFKLLLLNGLRTPDKDICAFFFQSPHMRTFLGSMWIHF